MVLIPAGGFTLGSEAGRADEEPVQTIQLDPFWIDIHEVTNQQFKEFVDVTGYKTVAEKTPDAKDFPGVPAASLVPGSLVFAEGEGWKYVPGASWLHPEGPDSNIEKRMNHPVVQVCWDDAMAYAKWAKKSLPTEAQFERAAKGGKDSNRYAWGDTPVEEGKPRANFWQGAFPTKNDNTDGFATTSPVGSFPKNGYGLSDMSGNVWEWCLDFYRPDAYKTASKINPAGPQDSFDPDEPGMVKRVVRGGSFLCAECYCSGYRVSARMKSSPDTGLCHTGFRCVINVPNEKPN